MVEPRIVSDPRILLGKPTIAGTRISVELILDNLGAGDSVDDILESYPHLTREAVLAAIRYAADVLRADEVHPIPESAA